MIQRWKREKSVGDQNCSACVFPSVFQKVSYDDLCQTDRVISNPSSQLVVECEKKHISKTQHDPTVDAIDMATGALLAPPNSAPLSSQISSIVSVLFSFFYLVWWPLYFFKGIFSVNYNFIP
jgi:hypothetical protein